MAIVRYETVSDCPDFQEQIFFYHHKLCCGNIYENRRDVDALCSLIEGMTNIDTPEKIDAFCKLCDPPPLKEF